MRSYGGLVQHITHALKDLFKKKNICVGNETISCAHLWYQSSARIGFESCEMGTIIKEVYRMTKADLRSPGMVGASNGG